MVKFSDLEKQGPASKKSQEGFNRPSRLSFRDLEKKSQTNSLSENTQPEDVNLEERLALYEAAAQFLTGALEAVKRRRPFTLEYGEEIIRQMVDFPLLNDPLLVRALREDNPRGFLIPHCVNVTVFTVKLATALGLSVIEQEQVGLAALLHEVGMGVIPEQRIYAEHKLEGQDYAIFKKRPELSYKILKGYGDAYAFLAETALQVHECQDGSGYPLGLRGEEIHLYAQIVGLADLYEALTHSRPQRDKFSHFSAFKQVIKVGKRCYSKKLLKALLNTISVFPLDSYVKLNSQAIGQVVEIYPDQPLRPTIELVFDSQGRRVFNKHVINLSENSILYIVDSVLEEDLPGAGATIDAKAEKQPISEAPAQESAVIFDLDDTAEKMGSPEGSVEVVVGEMPEQPEPALDFSDTEEIPLEITEDELEDEGEIPDIQEDSELSGIHLDDDEIESVQTGKGRGKSRPKWVFVVAGFVVLAGVLFWLLGGVDYFSEKPETIAPLSSAAKPTSDNIPIPPEPLPIEEKVEPVPMSKDSAVEDAKEVLTAGQETGDTPQVSEETKTVSIPVDQTAEITTPEAIAEISGKPDTISGPDAVIPASTGDTAPKLKKWERTYPYSVKLDAFRTEQEANAALAAFAAKGLNAYWVKVNLGSQGVWYRVFEGFYPTRKFADVVAGRIGLERRAVKEIKYAVLLGRFLSQEELDTAFRLAADKGYCPYVIRGEDQVLSLFVGAFYTYRGATDLAADLIQSGLQGEIVER